MGEPAAMVLKGGEMLEDEEATSQVLLLPIFNYRIESNHNPNRLLSTLFSTFCMNWFYSVLAIECVGRCSKNYAWV